MSATKTRATAPAPMSIATKVSIMPPIGVTSICLQSPPPVRFTPGTFASSGGAKVLFIRGLPTGRDASILAQRVKAGLHHVVVEIVRPGTGIPSCGWLRLTPSSSCASVRRAAATTGSLAVECRPTRPVRADLPRKTIRTTTATDQPRSLQQLKDRFAPYFLVSAAQRRSRGNAAASRFARRARLRRRGHNGTRPRPGPGRRPNAVIQYLLHYCIPGACGKRARPVVGTRRAHHGSRLVAWTCPVHEHERGR